MSVFRLAMHPASEGDALMLTWGDGARPRHALVDLGRTKNYRALKPLLKGIAEIDLFTITHIDADHIAGAFPLLKGGARAVKGTSGLVHRLCEIGARNGAPSARCWGDAGRPPGREGDRRHRQERLAMERPVRQRRRILRQPGSEVTDCL